MLRAGHIAVRGAWDEAAPADRVLLDAHERHCRRVVLTGEGGLRFLLDLPHAAVLEDGDGLVLEDARIVQVVGRPEPLVEIAGAAPEDVLRFAWHIGNRHADLEVRGARLRIRRDHVLEEMLVRLGAQLTPVEAPFRPERGAYAGHGGHGDAAHAHDPGHSHHPARSHDHAGGDGPAGDQTQGRHGQHDHGT
jgi:urease accessory protein